MENTGELSAKKRQPGFELLRIIAMLMILTLHFNGHTGALLQRGQAATPVGIFATLTEAICITGVNAYVLISGYFLSKGKVRMSRLLRLICQVYFYTILIFAVMMIIGADASGTEGMAYKLAENIFPISSEHYWFITAYIIMFLFAPVMNAAVEKLTKRQLQVVIFSLLIWFCFIKSVVPVLFATDRYGYDYGWFMCLYLIAAYIRRYDIALISDAKKSALVFAISVAVIFTMMVVLHYVNYRTGSIAHYATVPSHFNFFFTLTASLGLFSFFRFFEMKEGAPSDVIRAVGPLTLGVYLLHMHLEIRNRWVEWIAGLIGDGTVPLGSVPAFVLYYLISILIMFAAGIFGDFICKMFLGYAGRILHDTRLFRKIRQLDEELC